MANSLISKNSQRIVRELRAHPNNELADIHIVQWQTMEQEAKGVAEFTKRLIRQGQVKPGRVLILAPRKQFGYAARDALKCVGVPAHSFFREQELDGDPKKLAESRTQQAFTLLALVADPADHVALRCWCGFGSSDLRAKAWDRIRKLCNETNQSLPDVLEGIRTGTINLAYGTQIVNRLEELNDRLKELFSLQAEELFDGIFPKADKDFEQIRNAMAEGFETEADANILLDQLRTNITQPELPTDVDYVRVMSLHKSKGLTADLVIVMGCIEGLIPNVPDNVLEAERQKVLEEQRRLFYVAITRARKFLVLSSVTSLPLKFAHRMRVKFQWSADVNVKTIASYFLLELGPTCPQPMKGSELLSFLRERQSSSNRIISD